MEFCCSVKCRAVKQHTSQNGTANPNYRHGKHVGEADGVPGPRRSGATSWTTCGCGRQKDYRSTACAICSKRGFSKNGELHYDEGVMRKALLTSRSLNSAALLAGCSRHIVTEFAKRESLDLSHMRGGRGRPRTPERIFCRKQKRDGTTRKHFRALDPEAYFCVECGQLPRWNGRELVLQMEHRDGDCLNDCLENLCWLCPNCHTQTPTYTGRNSRGTPRRKGG